MVPPRAWWQRDAVGMAKGGRSACTVSDTPWSHTASYNRRCGSVEAVGKTEKGTAEHRPPKARMTGKRFFPRAFTLAQGNPAGSLALVLGDTAQISKHQKLKKKSVFQATQYLRYCTVVSHHQNGS